MSVWRKCMKKSCGALNLADTIKESGGKCPQCGGKRFKIVPAPQIGQWYLSKRVTLLEKKGKQ